MLFPTESPETPELGEVVLSKIAVPEITVHVPIPIVGELAASVAVVAQIVDARNPLLFYCEDLVKYVKEIDEQKVNLLIINKSDFLSERQRLAWFRYFKGKNVNIAFWSAAISIQEEEEASKKINKE